jgi:biopolymer transport protein ExbB
MLELLEAGGWVMLPLVLAAIVATAVVLERLWALRRSRIAPPHLTAQLWGWLREGTLSEERLESVRLGSPLGRLLVLGLGLSDGPPEVLRERLEDAGRQTAHELGRYLNTLGTIAAVSPLLGLLGSVLGIMRAFTHIAAHGAGDPRLLAGGVSEALVATAAGLAVAIPSLIAYRLLRGRVQDLTMRLEHEVGAFLDALRRRREGRASAP